MESQNQPPNPPESNDSYAGSSPPPPPPPTFVAPMWPVPEPPKRRSFFGRLFKGILIIVFIFSILLNLSLLVMVGSTAAGAGWQTTTTQSGKPGGQTVAVYDIFGAIDKKQSSMFESFCRQVRQDPDVKAVVLRVNSPGGSVAASDQMYYEIEGLKANGKKVIVSMGSVAASGGYYISAGADKIIDEPTTITGSIGVIGVGLVLKDTMAKIGAEPIIMRSTNARGWKAAMNSFEKPDDRQRAHLQRLLDDMQMRFENVVKSGRPNLVFKDEEYELTVGEGEEQRIIAHKSREPFNGKIYLANEAKQLGLIDDIGYLDQAIEVAKAGLDKPSVVHYSRRKGFMKQMLESRASANLGLNIETLDKLQTPRLMMLWKVE